MAGYWDMVFAQQINRVLIYQVETFSNIFQNSSFRVSKDIIIIIIIIVLLKHDLDVIEVKSQFTPSY